jgi:hypothetical protein
MRVRAFTLFVALCVLLVGAAACGSGGGSGQPTPTATARISQSAAEQAVIAYLQGQANTSHGQEVLAEFLDRWHMEGDYLDEEGNWVQRAGIYTTEAFNNPLLKNVFANPEEGSYIIEWWVGDNGSVVYTHNWNAARLNEVLHQE